MLLARYTKWNRLCMMFWTRFGLQGTKVGNDAISSVADTLFVIADGYTNPVRCREDLVRHGYLRA